MRLPAISPARTIGQINNLSPYDLVTLTVDPSGTYFSSDKNIDRHLEETCKLQDSE